MAKYCPYCVSKIEQGNSCPYCNYAATYRYKEHQLRPGTLLNNKYLVGRVLGEGGFGITYVGRDLTLDMKVAIKEYYPNGMVGRTTTVSNDVSLFNWTFSAGFKSGKEQFINEAQTIAKMDKESAVVTVRDFFEQNNSAYIVMEFVEGDDLKTIMNKQRKTFEVKELFPLLEPLFKALGELHSIGLIHRDISPDNIMIEKGRARLIDFGCARDTMNTGASTDAVLKHGFSPVEQYSNSDMGPWSDVYAMAATIYFCLTGRMVPKSTDRAQQDTLETPSSLGVKMNPKQERALMKALAIRREDRYQSMEEFGKDLFIHRNRYKYIAIAAGAVIVLALAAFLLFDPGSRVEQMSVRNPVYQYLTLKDDISADEKKMVQQVTDMLEHAELGKSPEAYSSEYRLTLKNTTDYDIGSMNFVYRTYNADGTITGSSNTSSFNNFKKGNASATTMYLDSIPARLAVKAKFSTDDGRYQTDYVDIPIGGEATAGAVEINITNGLPVQLQYVDYSGKISLYTVESADVSTTQLTGSYWATISISGIYDSGPTNVQGRLEYRITSESGAVLDTGTVSMPKLNPGERFDNVKIDIYSIPAGTYNLELMSYDSKN